MKKCNRCGVAKSLDDFHKNKSSKDGHGTRCKPCSAAYNKEWQARNPEKARESWKKSFAKTYDPVRNKVRKYGLTVEEFNDMVLGQESRCAICNEERELHIDHCHSSGKVRGLLCLQCNTALGNMNDSVETLQRAIEYLMAP